MRQDIVRNLKDIFRRIRKRDFSGNTGIVVKNSIFQFSTNLSAKIGALLFTIILARMLMPELFGLYTLALATIIIFFTFSVLGIGETQVRFISREFGKNIKLNKAKSYTLYLGKLRLFLTIGSILILMISANFISNTYYQKPIFLALIAGSLYILFLGIVGFLKSALYVSNYFKGLFYHEVIFQIVRLIIIPLIILLSLKQLLSNEFVLFFIILGLSFSYFISLIFLFFLSKNKLTYLKEKGKKITLLEKKKVNKFIIPVATMSVTALLFGSVDTVMLGGFVLPEFIGYYGAAFSLVGVVASFATFSIVLLPIFSRLKSRQLEKGFKKSVSITFLFSLILLFFVFLLSPLIISFIYGSLYELSINILRFSSLLLISFPIISVYTSYFTAKGKPGIVTKVLIFSLIINILLNLSAIYFLRNYGDLVVVYGVTGATIISNWFYMFGLIINKKRKI